MTDFLDSFGSPDDAVKWLLGVIFGSSSVIVTVFVIVNGLKGWNEARKSAVHGFRKARTKLGEVRETMRPASAGAITAMYVLVVVLQAVWLFINFIIGVAISAAVGDGPDITTANFRSWAGFQVILSDNTAVSAGVLAASVLAVLVAYGNARRGADSEWLVAVFGGLPCLFAIFALIGAGISALIWVLGWKGDPDANLGTILMLLACAATCYAYYRACAVVILSPRLLRRLRQGTASA